MVGGRDDAHDLDEQDALFAELELQEGGSVRKRVEPTRSVLPFARRFGPFVVDARDRPISPELRSPSSALRERRGQPVPAPCRHALPSTFSWRCEGSRRRRRRQPRGARGSSTVQHENKNQNENEHEQWPAGVYAARALGAASVNVAR